MKGIYNLIVICMTFTSCNDFLNLTPHSEISVDNFYQTEDDFIQAVNGAYEPFRGMYNTTEWRFGEMKSDNTTYIFHVAKSDLEGEDPDQFLEKSNSGYVATKYNNSYVIIGRCNRILSEIDKATFNESLKNNFKGQALFLRALSYFNLVQYFGRVPLHIEPTIVYEEAFKPRSSVEEVYEQIISDAKLAIDLLPIKSKQSVLGYATQGAALTLLGNVYIVLKRWNEAETVLKQVVDSKEYELLSDYSSIFDINNKNNKESIFEIQYLETKSLNQASDFIYRFLPYLSNPSAITGASPNPCPANVDHGGFNIPTIDMIEAYEDGDKRLDASIGIVEGILLDNYSLDGESVQSIINYKCPKGKVSYPFIKKYYHPHTDAYYAADNWPVYRYAEVLLFLAEAVNEQGRPNEAVSYINSVFGNTSIRGRAGLNPIVVSGVEQMRKVIEHERRVELAFENKRWLDLVRTGRATDVMTKHGLKIKANPQLYYWPEGMQPVENAYVFKETCLLSPIPLREIDLNSLMEQNPGY